MTQTIGAADLVRMLRAAAEQIHENNDELTKLDSATGDGDHGMAMGRAMDAMLKAIDDAGNVDSVGLEKLFYDIGWAVMGVDGGSTGPLFGSLFMGMSDGAKDKETLDAEAVAAMFQAGLAKIQKQSKAQPGDKTMMDALVPAVEAMQAEAASGDVAAMMAKAAEAAAEGAASTKDMQAKFGRAKNLGERSKGHADPGATSTAYVFKGLAEGAAE